MVKGSTAVLVGIVAIVGVIAALVLRPAFGAAADIRARLGSASIFSTSQNVFTVRLVFTNIIFEEHSFDAVLRAFDSLGNEILFRTQSVLLPIGFSRVVLFPNLAFTPVEHSGGKIEITTRISAEDETPITSGVTTLRIPNLF